MSKVQNERRDVFTILTEYEGIHALAMQAHSLADLFTNHFTDYRDIEEAVLAIRCQPEAFGNLAQLICDLLYDVKERLNRATNEMYKAIKDKAPA